MPLSPIREEGENGGAYENHFPERSSPRVTSPKMTRLVIELVDPADTPQLVVVHWPAKATAVRPAAYGESAARAMRLLANADVALARLRARRRQPKVER